MRVHNLSNTNLYDKGSIENHLPLCKNSKKVHFCHWKGPLQNWRSVQRIRVRTARGGKKPTVVIEDEDSSTWRDKKEQFETEYAKLLSKNKDLLKKDKDSHELWKDLCYKVSDFFVRPIFYNAFRKLRFKSLLLSIILGKKFKIPKEVFLPHHY